MGQYEDGGMMGVSGMIGGWWDDGGQWMMNNSTPATLNATLGTWRHVERENGITG